MKYRVYNTNSKRYVGKLYENPLEARVRAAVLDKAYGDVVYVVKPVSNYGKPLT